MKPAYLEEMCSRKVQETQDPFARQALMLYLGVIKSREKRLIALFWREQSICLKDHKLKQQSNGGHRPTYQSQAMSR